MREDEGNPDRPRRLADTLPSADGARMRAIGTGEALGLPRAWLAALPEVEAFLARLSTPITLP
jgi:hypothetical protein